MQRLKESTLARLRDMLRDRGRRPSIGPVVQGLPESARELLQLSTEYGALCEAMYLMMAADDRVLNVERDVLKGAMRSLTDNEVRGAYIEAMVDTAAKRLAADGREARMKSVIEGLRDDPVKAEVAFVVAAAIALADGTLHEKERAMLDQLARGLAFDAARVEALMKDLADATDDE